MEDHIGSSTNSFMLFWTELVLLAFIAGLILQSIWPRSSAPHEPHTLPYIIPFLRSTLSFVFDGPNFFEKSLRYCHGRWPLCVRLLEDEIYLVQKPKNISSIFSHPALTVTKSYAIVLRYCFGMDQRALDVYLSDTSGSRTRPIRGSDVQDNRRVSYHTHENLVQGLLGEGLIPTTERIQDALFVSLDQVSKSEVEWTYIEDLTEFMEEHVGTALLKALFGPLLLADSPDFNRDLWKYDKRVMGLAMRLPIFCIPAAYWLRNKLLHSIMRWHRLASQLSAAMHRPASEKEDTDLLWGSTMMRKRYEMLLKIEGQDLRSVASTDFAFIWATVTNVVPSTMTLCTHMYRDTPVLDEIRASVGNIIEPGTKALKFDIKRLEKTPLLLALYAETLRFGVQIHIPRCAAHQNLHINNKLIPQGKLVLVNTWVAHMDKDVWNTRDGEFPLDTFWARRFLVDPKDEHSGPVIGRRQHTLVSSPNANREREHGSPAQSGVKFSIEGLDGAWIPYGGGQHACPGRLLAKRTMLLTAAMMAAMFDVEVLAPEQALKFGSPRFGFGVRKPVGRVPFRIRRRV